MTSNPGLCYVTSVPKDPTQLPDALFNDFYDNEHVPDMLRYKFSHLALRYKNSNPDSPLAYLALYPLDDPATLASPESAKMMEECSKSRVLGGRNHHDLIQYGVGVWEKIQTFEGPDQSPERGQTLVAVSLEPGDGAEAEADVDAWYRKEHLDMLSKGQGYRRSTRYKRFGTGEAPTFLALHEYACMPEELPAERIQKTRETDWARDVLGKAKKFDREVWSLIGAQGEEGAKL